MDTVCHIAVRSWKERYAVGVMPVGDMPVGDMPVGDMGRHVPRCQ